MDNWKAPIYPMEEWKGNHIHIMRDDLLPFSFGGNKARKAKLFFEAIDRAGCDAVVTYGSGGSNHCRVIANMAAQRGIPCAVVSTDEESASTNRCLLQQFGVQMHFCKVDHVAETIRDVIAELENCGYKTFFIPGGGHGNIGTSAYDLAYDEIRLYEEQRDEAFDYIFHASGTGTTQAGLICGKARWKDPAQIVGISIARKNPRGGQVVAESVRDYMGTCLDEELCFVDDYVGAGYGKYDVFVEETICRVMTDFGIPLDPTYTGKAYAGMLRFLEKNNICGKKILFIHTGGTPLFCDWVRER